jgi:ABC-type multidrug transport system fused ATPase/permease subunit
MATATEDNIEVHADPPGFLLPPSPALEGRRRNSAVRVAEPSGLDDPLKPREGRDLVWKDVNMTINGKGDTPPKKILDDVWGEVPRRQVTAIMGPSGSGKVRGTSRCQFLRELQVAHYSCVGAK